MITIINLKTNLTGQVADHIGLDTKLLESQGYARIETPVMPVYSEPSITQDQKDELFTAPVKVKKARRPRIKKNKSHTP